MLHLRVIQLLTITQPLTGGDHSESESDTKTVTSKRACTHAKLITNNHTMIVQLQSNLVYRSNVVVHALLHEADLVAVVLGSTWMCTVYSTHSWS